MVLEYVLAWPQLSTLCLTLQAAKQITTKRRKRKIHSQRSKNQKARNGAFGIRF